MEKKIGVVVRVRPQLQEDNVWVNLSGPHTLQTVNHRNTAETLQYEFSHVFGPDTSQECVYGTCVAPLLQHTLKGQNASVLAYGPTGAGKTHTILGSSKDPGIIPRCVEDMFSLVRQDHNTAWKTELSYSYLEIYNEKVYDLLGGSSSTTDLPIRMGSDKQVQVAGLTQKNIKTLQQFKQSFTEAAKNRTVAATKLNEHSSRSHSLLLLRVFRRESVAPYRQHVGKLYVIDLAGSEDNRRTGNHGARLKESGAINTSLLALGQVVNALNKGQTRVPYRDSKLTRLLQDSLGGNSHACMIVNLAPEEQHYYDTFSTLNFASRTKKIVNTIRTNETKPVIEEKIPLQNVTKRHAEDNADSAEATPAKRTKPENLPFLSPLLRNQEKFKTDLKDEVMKRLEKLEERLMVQMQEGHRQFNGTFDSPTAKQPTKHKDTAANNAGNEDDIMHKLDGLLGRIQEAKVGNTREDHGKERRRSGRIKHTEKNVKNKTVYSDGSSSATSHPSLTDITSSPLFLLPPSRLKRKGFRSTAAASSTKPSHDLTNTDTFAAPHKENVPKWRDPAVQKSHNDQTLQLLNSGTAKELQDLQTVGTKRAKLIHDYRALHGNFTQFSDLLNVPGITEKYLGNFLRSNLIELSV